MPSPAGVVKAVLGTHAGAVLVGQAPLGGATSLLRDSIGLIGLALLGLVAWALWALDSRWVAGLVVAGFALVEVLVLIGDLRGGASGRYAVMPMAILVLGLVHCATASKATVPASVAIAMLGVVLVVGLLQFWGYSGRDLTCDGCASWTAQVASYERGGSRELVIWPYGGGQAWVILMPPRTGSTSSGGR